MLRPMNDANWGELVAVNDQVNGDTRYRTDLDAYGREEFWAVANGQGDCEDFALAKRRELLGRGWAPESVRLATCETPDGEGHAVLTVDTEDGTYVLDNRYPTPQPWNEVPYTWRSRQAAEGSGWVEVGDDPRR